jgi:hypothetical protein
MPDSTANVKDQPYQSTKFGRPIEDWPEPAPHNYVKRVFSKVFALFDVPATFIRGQWPFCLSSTPLFKGTA